MIASAGQLQKQHVNENTNALVSKDCTRLFRELGYRRADVHVPHALQLRDLRRHMLLVLQICRSRRRLSCRARPTVISVLLSRSLSLGAPFKLENYPLDVLRRHKLVRHQKNHH